MGRVVPAIAPNPGGGGAQAGAGTLQVIAPIAERRLLAGLSAAQNIATCCSTAA